MGHEHSKLLAAQRLHMHRSIKPDPHHLCYATRIVAVRLVDLCLQHGPHVSCLDTNHWQARFGENAVKPLRQRSSFQPNSLEAIDGVRQNLQQSFRFTCHPRFPHDLARIIHNADARFLDRDIQSSKIVHAALLLRCLRPHMRTSFHHQPEAQRPNFPLSTSWQADYPIFRAKRTSGRHRPSGFFFSPGAVPSTLTNFWSVFNKERVWLSYTTNNQQISRQSLGHVRLFSSTALTARHDRSADQASIPCFAISRSALSFQTSIC